MSYPKLEDLECDDIHSYCKWEGPATTGGPNGPISCEGCYCADAYESWKAEHVVTCEVCGQEVDIDACIEDTDDCHKFYVCNDCIDAFGGE